MESLTPKNHLEEVALFRYALIGELARRSLEHGECAEELRRISTQRVRPPGSDTTRCYAVPTLERWLYACREGGLPALTPKGRGDRGRGRHFDPVLKELLCDIRREHPDVSVTLMLRTLRADGRIGPEVKECTVRRMLCEQGLPRMAPAEAQGPRARLRWQAERPNALWHGDVCHGPTLTFDGRRTHVRVHAMLDDASRAIVGLCVAADEREETMLKLFARAVMEHGRPDVLYLDNGATYRGIALSTACSRLGTGLRHAKPYDAAARGKMETLLAPHAGERPRPHRRRRLPRRHRGEDPHVARALLPVRPARRAARSRSRRRLRRRRNEARVRGGAPRRSHPAGAATRTSRQHRIASTATTYEVPLGYLAGQVVTVATSLFDGDGPRRRARRKTHPLGDGGPDRERKAPPSRSHTGAGARRWPRRL
ncbi:MAG: DDE-type integrase/transposase/recombinase [Microthrixaceae bacterium]